HEVIVNNREKDKGDTLSYAKRIVILNGNDASIKQAIQTNYQPENGVTMGKIEGVVWFFASGRGGQIEGYAFNGSTGLFERKWAHTTGSTKKRPVVLGLADFKGTGRSEEHTSELQSRENLVC